MLKNKSAIVTGATRGIGKEIARTLAQNGAHICFNHRTYNEEIESFINELEGFDVRVLAFKCDVSTRGS